MRTYTYLILLFFCMAQGVRATSNEEKVLIPFYLHYSSHHRFFFLPANKYKAEDFKKVVKEATKKVCSAIGNLLYDEESEDSLMSIGTIILKGGSPYSYQLHNIIEHKDFWGHGTVIWNNTTKKYGNVREATKEK